MSADSKSNEPVPDHKDADVLVLSSAVDQDELQLVRSR